MEISSASNIHLRPELFYKLIYGEFFSDIGSGGTKKKKSFENDFFFV